MFGSYCCQRFGQTPLPFKYGVQKLKHIETMSEEKKTENTQGNGDLAVVSGMLPNEIDLEQLSRLLAYSDKYEISIQFWPKQIAVYIAKDGVDLQDYGGDFDFAIGRSIEYLDRVTGNYR